MTSLDELIQGRRSIRKYKENIPPMQWIEMMVYCATRAPSPTNSQAFRFIRINSSHIKDRLYQAMSEGVQTFLHSLEMNKGPQRMRNWINSYRRFSEFMFRAPILFAVGTVLPVTGFSEKLHRAGIIDTDVRGETDVDISVGLALKGFILKGQELGLGTCILTAPLIFIREIETILGMSDVRIKCFVTVGYPDEEPPFLQKKGVDHVYFEI